MRCWEINGFLHLTREKLTSYYIGVPGLDFQINVNLFSSVQSFISQSNRFVLFFVFCFFVFNLFLLSVTIKKINVNCVAL